MKIKLELYGASREFSEKDYLEFSLKEKSSINDLRNEILSFIDKNFKVTTISKNWLNLQNFVLKKTILLLTVIKLQKIKKLESFHL